MNTLLAKILRPASTATGRDPDGRTGTPRARKAGRPGRRPMLAVLAMPPLAAVLSLLRTGAANGGTVIMNLGRRLRGGTQALAVAAALAGGVVALTSAQPAFAAGTTGYLNPAHCGWHLVQGYADPFKQSTVWLPYVTGLSSTYQEVDLHVEFMNGRNGTLQTYRELTLYTYARSGVWSTSWTYNGRSGYITAQDLLGDSGFATGDAGNLDTYVRLTAYWYSSSKLVGALSEYATNPWSSAYPYVCNAGTNYA